MSTCSAAEIEQKRKLALEKLKAKKAVATNSPSTTTQSLNNNINKPTLNPSISVPNFYKATPSTSTENKASSFLNALKQSNVLSSRQGNRDSIHPYNRPQGSQHQGNKNDPKRPTLSLTPPVANVFSKTITCTVYMISATRFEVKTSGFHGKLIEAFKTIPSKVYDVTSRLWNFSIKDYQQLQQKVATLNPEVVIGSIPKSVVNLCLAPPKELDYSCLKSIEPVLQDKLMPFQEEGVCFAIAQHGRLMICDEMGLGKTYQALAVADFYKENWPLFICTTASTRESWASHVRTLLPSVPVHYVQVLTNNQQYFGDAKILITSYNMMERHITSLLERKFGFLIFDESHMLKNHKAKCTTVADRLAMQAKHVILLSGTPALSRPLELFTQIQMVDRKFMNFIEFTSRYCDGKQTHFGWDANGQSNLQELNVVLKLKYMIRRTKADVLPDMAAKFRETVVLDPSLVWPSDDVKATLDKVAKDFLASKGREREEILLSFYAETASVKTRAVCAYLKTLIKEKVKFIVFAHHRVMLDAITECMIRAKVDYIRIDGGTKNDARAEYIKTFQTKSSCKVAVLSLKACNSGITLTAAEMIVFAELDWNPSTLAQAESRAHRIGQDKPVICRYLMASKTADDVIWNMLKNKQDTLNKAGLFCENLQDATKTINQTTSYKIDSYYSPNKTRRSSTGLNTSNSSLNESLNNSLNNSTENKKNDSFQSPIDKFLIPVKKPPPPEPPKETTSISNSLRSSSDNSERYESTNPKISSNPQLNEPNKSHISRPEEKIPPKSREFSHLPTKSLINNLNKASCNAMQFSNTKSSSNPTSNGPNKFHMPGSEARSSLSSKEFSSVSTKSVINNSNKTLGNAMHSPRPQPSSSVSLTRPSSPSSLSISKKPTSSTSKYKEADLFEEFFNDDDDEAIACLKSQIPSNDSSTPKTYNQKDNCFNIPKPIRDYDDLFDDADDEDIAALKSQIPNNSISEPSIVKSKDMENVDDFFGEEDDDAFKDLMF